MLSVARATLDRWTNDPDYAHLNFPKPVRLYEKRISTGKNKGRLCSRVFYVKAQMIEWIEAHFTNKQ